MSVRKSAAAIAAACAILAALLPATASAKPSSGPATTGGTPNPSGIDEAQIRRGLEPKVWSGKASVEEIRMLKAICSHMGDRACRDRAAQMLKQKLDSQK